MGSNYYFAVVILIFLNLALAVNLKPNYNKPINFGAGQDTRETVVCQKYINGSLNKDYYKAVSRDEPYMFVFLVDRKYFVDSHKTNLRIEAEVETTSLDEPILFSIAQRKYTTTFELPHSFNRSQAQLYRSAARNLCIQRRDFNRDAQNITVRVSTSSIFNVTFKLKLSLTEDFQLQIGKNLTVEISPTTPRYFGFQSATPDMSVIKIRALSPTNTCMTLSVQTPYCPVYDKEVNVRYQGLWQTMTVQSAMTVELVNRFSDGFVVVLVAHDSDTKCSKSPYINPYEPPPGGAGSNKTLSFYTGEGKWSPVTRGKFVTLIITNESSVNPFFVFLAMWIPVFTTLLLIFAVTLLFRNRHAWMRIEAEQKLTAINCGLLNSVKEDTRPQQLSIQPDGDGLVLQDLGVLPSPTDEDEETIRTTRRNVGGSVLSPTRERPASDFLKIPTERFYDNGGHSRFRWKADLKISDFKQKDPSLRAKSGRRFYWTIIIVAIFYCIPVYQLILHYLRVLYRTGEYDICYYNYLCAHRLGLFVDFNHFWSNISYIVFGIAFICLVSRRARSMNMVNSPTPRKHGRTRSGTHSVDGDIVEEEGFLKRCFGYAKIPVRPDHGIPQNWGIFYALGIALSMEGVLSAAYHLCPNQSSFQFDTCFMYVIAVLILLQIYQFRHSIHFGANQTFVILAAFVLISVIGLMFEFQGTKAKQVYRWSFIALQFVTMTLFALYLYGIGYVKSSDKKMLTDISVVGNLGQMRNRTFNGDRLILPLISFVMGIAVLIYCELSDIDFATYLLYVLVANVIGTTFYYVGIMKPLHGEFKNRTWVQPVIYFLGAGVIGGFAVIYFVRSPAAWELSAADSRAGNEECVNGWFPFFPYYDSHDIWHFLSSASLFLSFMALLIVDDDLLTTPQTKIAIF